MSDRPKQNYMYKNEFVDELASKLGVERVEAESIYHAFLDIFKETWSLKRTICFSNFGVFELRPMAERMGRNPQTMESVLIPSMYKPVFRPTNSLRDHVNQAIKENEASQLI